MAVGALNSVSGLSESHAGPGFAMPHPGIGRLVMATEILMICLSSLAAGVGYHLVAFGNIGDPAVFAGVAAVTAVVAVPLIRARGLYGPELSPRLDSQLKSLVGAWVLGLFFLALLTFTFKLGEVLSRGSVLSFAAIGTVALGANRAAWKAALRRKGAQALVRSTRSVLISVGRDDEMSRIRAQLRSGGHQLVRDVRI